LDPQSACIPHYVILYPADTGRRRLTLGSATAHPTSGRLGGWLGSALLLLQCLLPARAGVLFEDNFGVHGWTPVQPPGVYLSGPLRWEYELSNGAFVEQSNIYTDDATYSPTAIAPMLINDTVAGTAFTYSARLTAGDDDGFGLIFGYQDETNFYRVVFARQVRSAGFPWHAWVVDRQVDGLTARLFGYGTTGYVRTFANRQGVPFDVTISVDASNRLTLAVLDNPTGTSTNYPLVTGQALPSAANGRVGVFTWGMSGLTPPGFRIQNLSLSPLGLAGDLGATTNWSAVIPPRAAGTNTVISGSPYWYLTPLQDSSRGVLNETGNCFGGNDSAGQVDFTGATLVAGSDTWTNYVVAARITPRDDDGHGILLRYRNPTNFYRIALRSEASTNGPCRGLSIQKNVNQAYTEVYRDHPVRYVPAANVPYDLVAQIATNTLDVLLVGDPEGAAQAYAYGPFTITGVDTGKIGLFSWGMSQTEFDWVSVQDGAVLYVSSPYGSPNPAKGLNSYPMATIVSATCGVASDLPGTRRIPTGWTGSGSAPTSGTGTNVTFRIATISRLHWQWRTEYQLSVTNGPGGTVSYPPGEWLPAGTNLTVIAQPNAGYAFAGWSGTSQSTAPTLNFTLDQPYTLVASFIAESDGDGLPDEWELAYFGNLDQGADDDPDSDGRANAAEFANGTNPKVADILRIVALELTNHTAVLSVSNNSGTRYSVQVATNLSGPWFTVVNTQYLGRCTVLTPTNSQSFWRLQQPGRPVDVPPFVAGSWTLAVLPDTQHYSQSHPELFKDQARWIVANKDRYNIQYVLHLGDIVNVNTAVQWTNARTAMFMLDGEVPYALAPGNHDFSTLVAPRATLFNDFFPLAKYQSWPTFGGVREPGRLENSYHLFSAGGVDWLLFALEYGPRNGTVAWASQIASNYPARKKILITHAYLYDDDTRYDWAAKGSAQSWSPHAGGAASDPEGTNDGEELWQKLVKIHANWVMTINGHVLHDGLGRVPSTNDFGQVVHQMLVNYQMQPLGGEARLRLMEFRPDGQTVQIKAYSPFYGDYKTDTQNQFMLTLEPPLH